MKEIDSYPYPVSITKSSYRGLQLTEEQKSSSDVQARRSLPPYLFFGHCADESNPFDNMQKREFYSSYSTLYQDPHRMESVREAAVTFLEAPETLPSNQRYHKEKRLPQVGRFVTTNQLTMPPPAQQSFLGKSHKTERTFRKSLEQNGLLLNLRS